MQSIDQSNSLLAYDDIVVAVDLGSNSFHLLQAQLDEHGQMRPLATEVCKVQLALAIKDGQLHPNAIQRGLDCLSQFASYTQHLPARQLRVVATQALRMACNRDEFIKPAMELLGQSIDVIDGEEEAVLAYMGVVSAIKNAKNESRLVVDIGGGSTELACGCGAQPDAGVSLPVGCVTWLQYFPAGVINQANFDQAYQAAYNLFVGVEGKLTAINGDSWQLALGCSGTLLAIEEVLIKQGWSDGGISTLGLGFLKQALLGFNNVEQVNFQGLTEERRSIFASGLAIVLALFDGVGIEYMQLSQSALREGVAWQLLNKNS